MYRISGQLLGSLDATGNRTHAFESKVQCHTAKPTKLPMSEYSLGINILTFKKEKQHNKYYF